MYIQQWSGAGGGENLLLLVCEGGAVCLVDFAYGKVAVFIF